MDIKPLKLTYTDLDDDLIRLGKRIMRDLPLKVDEYGDLEAFYSLDLFLPEWGFFGVEFGLVPTIRGDKREEGLEGYLYWSGVERIDQKKFEVVFGEDYLRVIPKRIVLPKHLREDYDPEAGIIFNIFTRPKESTLSLDGHLSR